MLGDATRLHARVYATNTAGAVLGTLATAYLLLPTLGLRNTVLVGVGVSDAEQAYQATRVADGVIQGASVVRRLMESGPDAVGDYVAEVRAAIDQP